MTSVSDQRKSSVAETIARIRKIEASKGVSCESLDLIMKEMLALAENQQFFSLQEFPAPAPGVEESRLYLLSRDSDDRFTLYMNSLNPGKSTPPHDHTTWAVVVAVEGTELNRIYRREDDGSKENYAKLVLDREVMVEPGHGIALMPEEIHSIHTTGKTRTRHLHLYGLALDKLDERTAFDLNTGQTQPYNKAFLQPTVSTPSGT